MGLATNASSLQTNTTNPFPQSQLSVTAQVTSLAVLGFVIVFGNLACIITFIKTQSLRRKSHYLIIFLSVADLCVGGVVFMSIYYFVGVSNWYHSDIFTHSLDFLDSLTSNGSMLTLVAISLERFYAIIYPFLHRRLRFRHYLVCVIVCWFVSLANCFPYLLAVIDQPELASKSEFMLFYRWLAVITPVLALLVISFSYITIAVKMRRKNRPEVPNHSRPLRDQKLVVTLVIVTLTSLLTWLPLQCLGVILFFCPNCVSININLMDLVFFVKYLQYCNSAINVFMYIVRMPEFRKAFLNLTFHRAPRDSSQPQTRRMPTFIISFQNRGFELTETSNGKKRQLDSKINQQNKKLNVILKGINERK